jgi:hypothetical protein
MPALIRTAAVLSKAACLIVVAAGCAPSPADPPAPPASDGTHRLIIIDLDRYGVILLDSQAKLYRGIRRGHGEVWQLPASAALVSCLGECPNAALSSTVQSLNSPSTPDPVPSLVVEGTPAPLAEPVFHSRRILWGTSQKDLVLSVGSPVDGWRLTMAQHDGWRDTPVGGANTTWQTSLDERHALAITTVPGGNEARWFDRDPSAGWRQAGQTMTVKGLRACVSPDGQRAVLIGQRPVLLDRAGTQTPIGDLVAGGACAFNGASGLIAELAQGAGGLGRSRVRAFDEAGRVFWSKDLDVAVTLCGAAGSPRAAYVGAGRLIEVDVVSGRELHTQDGLAAACYDETGQLVTVGPDATVDYP